ncbi:type III pantothenate kinase [Sediminibacterium ginsengisoli]|uniref:Type III pantothenate kinase n=1 Tax=Sediminibacterium ginsengisoli TaxID=413434 RepID=A0A1T4JQP7_9BACT|nr:type III pantothenate kinase [Sediminibacterium ginsengisoli]SJZ32449.1 type III pantothenate kinase [Sediminibacterium ginsengisoli]
MQTTVCFDFGNTRLKCAVFKGREIAEIITLENDGPETIQALLDTWKPQKSILSSVIRHSETLEKQLADQTRFHKLGHTSRLPMSTPVGKPETIGADRLALCAAAVDLFPQQHNLVIALGTCITYNFINNQHQFLGGAISPGMNMRFRAMHEQTALLPLVKAEMHFPLVGYDTKTNMLSGVILGMAKEIDGIIDEYALKYSNFNVLLTGGDMGFFVSHLKKRIFADPYLIFKGLYAISEHNSGQA